MIDGYNLIEPKIYEFISFRYLPIVGNSVSSMFFSNVEIVLVDFVGVVGNQPTKTKLHFVYVYT